MTDVVSYLFMEACPYSGWAFYFMAAVKILSGGLMLSQTQHAILIRLICFVILFFIYARIADATTSGSITIEGFGEGIVWTTSSFSVNGSYVLLSDDDIPNNLVPPSCQYPQVSPNYWDGLQGIGDLAQVGYKVDGVYKGRLGIVRNGVNYAAGSWTDLGKIFQYSAPVDILLRQLNISIMLHTLHMGDRRSF